MGLDVYLYRKPAGYVLDWNEDEKGEQPVQLERIEIDSKIHPEHMFKIGYLRSSYNEGGINRVLRSYVDESLDNIFLAGDRYEFAPDWNAALVNAKRVHAKLKAFLDESRGLTVVRVAMNMFANPQEHRITEREAIERTAKMMREGKQGWFGNREGDFFLPGRGPFHGKDQPDSKPLQVVAAIPAIARGFMGRDEMIVHLVVVDESSDGQRWYLDALDVTIEMIEWVLAQPDPESFLLHWSG